MNESDIKMCMVTTNGFYYVTDDGYEHFEGPISTLYEVNSRQKKYLNISSFNGSPDYLDELKKTLKENKPYYPAIGKDEAVIMYEPLSFPDSSSEICPDAIEDVIMTEIEDYKRKYLRKQCYKPKTITITNLDTMESRDFDGTIEELSDPLIWYMICSAYDCFTNNLDVALEDEAFRQLDKLGYLN